MLSKIGYWIAGMAAGIWATTTNSTIGRILLETTIGKMAYAAYAWMMGENEAFAVERISDEHIGLIASQASRSQTMAFLQCIINETHFMTSTDMDRRRFSLIMSTYMSSLSASDTGLLVDYVTLRDEMVEVERASIEGSFDGGANDDHAIEAVNCYRVILTRMCHFANQIGLRVEDLPEFDSSLKFYGLLTSMMYNHPLYTEWRDGDLVKVPIYSGGAAPAAVFFILADLRENSSELVHSRVTEIQKAFASLSSRSNGYEWKMFVLDSFYSCAKTYFQNIQNDNEK